MWCRNPPPLGGQRYLALPCAFLQNRGGEARNWPVRPPPMGVDWPISAFFYYFNVPFLITRNKPEKIYLEHGVYTVQVIDNGKLFMTIANFLDTPSRWDL